MVKEKCLTCGRPLNIEQFEDIFRDLDTRIIPRCSMVLEYLPTFIWVIYMGFLMFLLIGGLEHDFFSIQLGIIISPIDELIFFRGVGSTTNQSIEFSHGKVLFFHCVVNVYQTAISV